MWINGVGLTAHQPEALSQGEDDPLHFTSRGRVDLLDQGCAHSGYLCGSVT